MKKPLQILMLVSPILRLVIPVTTGIHTGHGNAMTLRNQDGRATIPIMRISLLFMLLLVTGCTAHRKGETILDSDLRRNDDSSMVLDSVAHQQAISHYTAGSVAEQSDNLAEATIEYQLARQYDPASMAIGLALSRVYLKIGQTDAAINLLEQLHKSNPLDEEMHSMMAMVYEHEQRFEDAYKCFTVLEKLRALTKYERLRLAGFCYDTKRLDKAIANYEKYVAEFGADPDVYEQIGRLYILKRDLTKSEAAFRKAAKTDPSRPETHYMLGAMALERKDEKQALNDYYAALNADSTEPKYWAAIISLLSSQRDFARVLTLADSAIDYFPDEASFYGMKGAVLERLGRYDEAIRLLEKAVVIDSTDIGSHLSLAYIHHERKEWDAGAADYSKALTIEPDNPLILNNYAYMLSVQNANLDSAMAMVERALAATPDQPTYMDTKAWILYRLGRYQEALPIAEQVIKVETESAEVYYHLGSIYGQLGRTTEARKMWQKALQLEPDNTEYQRLAR